MNTSSSSRLFPSATFAATLVAFVVNGQAADVSYFITAKGAQYVQPGTGTPILSGATPWVFHNEVRSRLPGLVTNATLKFSNVTSNLAAECHSWGLQGAYTTSNALTAAFPNGTYTNTVGTLQDGVHAPVLSVTNNQYPPGPPHLTNYTAAQTIDPTASFKLGWDGFTGGTTNDFVLLELYDQFDNKVSSTPLPGLPGALTGVSNSYTFVSNSLPPGQALQGVLIFIRGNTTNTTAAYPGVRLLAGYFRETDFTLATTGTPDTSQPQLIFSNPYDTETNVPVNSSIVFYFDKLMRDHVSIAWSGNVNSNKFTYVWLPDQQTLVCSYYTNLPANSTITWTLNPSGATCGSFDDISGNSLTADMTGSFDTGSTGAGVKDVLLYGCGKQQQFTQTNSAAPATTNAFQFSAFVDLSATFTMTSASVQPSNGVASALNADAYGSGRNFNYQQDFTNQTSLDATFTNGPYFMMLNCVHDGTRTATNSLTGNSYPSIPHVSNFTAAQSVNPALNFTLTWDAFTGGTTNDFIQINISDNSYSEVFSSANYPGVPGALNGLSNAIVIPAGTLVAGQSYQAELFFAKLITQNTNAYPGVTGLTFYGRRTDFTLATPAAPPTMSSPARISPTQFQLLLGGSAGQNYTVEYSTTLTNWSTLYVTNAPASSFPVVDSNATNKWKFYRARVGP